MKIKEAIDWIDIARMGYICDPNECGFEKGGDPCKVFHCDEIHDALVMAMDTLKKQTPKKPTRTYKILGVVVEGFCAVCEESVLTEWDYCPNCGQAIDWGDTE